MTLTRVLAFLVLCGLGLGAAQTKSYVLQSVRQEVFLRADGTVRVEDTRALRLDGDFSDNEYFVVIDPAPGGTVRFEGVRALDGGPPAEAMVNGNEIAWKVRGADETRTFEFSYVLTGELQVAEDAARFARQVLEPEHAPVLSYRLLVHPPAPSPEQFRLFIFTGRGRIGRLDIADDASLATVTLSELSRDENVLAVALLDAALFDRQTVEGERLGAWLAEVEEGSEAFREESVGRLAAARGPSTLWAIPFWLVFVIVLAWFWRSYQRIGREPQTAEVGPYYREPAEELPPAVVPFVLSQNSPGLSAAGPAVAATLLDFARRGYLRLETVTSDGFLGLGSSDKVYYHIVGEPENLPPFEQDLWNAFEGAALQADKISLVGLFESMQGRDKPPTTSNRVFDADDLQNYFKEDRSFAQSWVSKPRAWYERTHGPLLDPRATGAAGPLALLSVVVGGIAFWNAFAHIESNTVLGLNLLAVGLLLVGLAIAAPIALKRWNPAKLLNARRWQAYKRFLSDFSLMREAPAEHYKLWDHHFVYATALGISKDYLKNLRRLMSEDPDRFVIPAWVAMRPGSLGPVSTLSSLDTLTGSLNTLSQIESNLNNLNRALAPQTKTGGGFGGGSGGFSGGSSGGGGSSGMR